MGLAEYRRKRDFRKTSEPRGKRAPRKGSSFVVQKHAASHLHYDFRLELDGVLKSWAVPKGPSLDPAQKRLAVAVEDHPLEYGKFEGTIPAGEYGGGTVMIWDRGTWEPIDDDAHASFEAGKLKFRLHGQKLTGGWMLVRTGGHGRDPRNWLLIKERDDDARETSQFNVIEEQPLSAATGRDLDEIAYGESSVWSTSGNGRQSKSGKSKKSRRHATTKRRSKGKPLPSAIKPQLATLVAKAPVGDQWLHELKFDGYRIVAYVDHGDVKLKTRNGLDWTPKLAELAAAASRLKVRQAIFDGEVVALDPRGASDFQTLQTAIQNKKGAIVYYVFDLLWLDDNDLRPLPLAERKARLEQLGLHADRGPIRIAEHILGDGPAFFAEAERMGLEGIISKRIDRPYVSGRTTDWVKVKCSGSGEFVIGGFTEPAGARHEFGALLLGYHEKGGKLVYAGRVGTGFDEEWLSNLGMKLRAREIKKSPFAGEEIKRERRAHWVRPELVAQIRFSNWTRDGMLRHPVFLGLREDKPAASVERELPRSIENNKQHANRAGRSGSATVEGIRLTHPDKVLFPDEEITKRDLSEYYLGVAQWMLPHIADRPLAIVRCPNGIAGSRFFQKHPSAGTLAGLDRVEIKEKENKGDYVVVQKASDLVELVQIGALELHQWGSRRDDIERPDRLTFDLDPDPAVAWSRTVEAARQIRDLLAELGLESFVKTSGGKGLHLVVPIARRHDWPYVTGFCQSVARAIERADPSRFVSKMTKSARVGKIYVDYLRNQRGATTVAAYSTRAKPGAPVSMPVTWEELGGIVSADQFQVSNAQRRINSRKRDPWAGIEKSRQALSDRMLKQLEG